MKKVLIFLLLVAMLFITACDSQKNDESIDANANLGANADMTPVGGIEETAEDPYAGWTLVFGKIYIPNLPFTDWEGGNQDNINCYTIYIKSNNSAAFHEYAQSLTNFGYTIEQSESYSYTGTDPENRKIHLTDYENGQMQIKIYY